MPGYKNRHVKITGESIGEPEFWVKLYNISKWSTSKIRSLQELIKETGDTPDEDESLSSIEKILPLLVADWNLVDEDDESDDPEVLPIPKKDPTSSTKIPLDFVVLIMKEFERLAEGLDVPLEKENSSSTGS